MDISTSPYFVELRDRIRALGGLFNAHLHLDRAGTYHATLQLLADGAAAGASHLSLPEKHALIPRVHASACYDPDQLEARVAGFVELLIQAGTSRADTVVDVTADRVGASALERLLRLQRKYSGRLDLRVGAYSPLGFRDDEPQRWELFEAGAVAADFIGSLPERDDQAMYPAHLGFAEHCRRMLALSARLDKPLHLHVDQQNHAREAGAECVVTLARELGLGAPRGAEPRVWLVHLISPAAYDEPRFAALVNALVELNIGVICCPSAAISMRQLRPVSSPTRNSIARALELLAAGVFVRLGSDNIGDITSPAGTTDLLDELFVFSNALRFYDLEILAKLGAGRPLEASARARLHDHLAQDAADVARTVARLANE